MSKDPNETKATEDQTKSSADPCKAGMAECPECRGSGAIDLLVSSRSCTRCGGHGRIEPEARGAVPEDRAPEPEADCEAYTYGAGAGAVVEAGSRTYDAQGRLLSQTCVGEEMRTYVLSDTGPGADDDDRPDAEPDAEAEE